MNFRIIYFLLFLTSASVLAQNKISGIIRDNSGEPLTGANIYLEGTYDGTSSNREGRFILETSVEGEQQLCIEFIGFRKIRKQVHLAGTVIELGSIELREEVNELNAITITAGTFEAGDKKKSIALSSLDMVTTDGSSGDVYGALQALPGTSTVGESGRLFVKGGDSRESKTFIDGTLVYVPYSSSSPNTSVRGRFSPFMFSGMMFSTGGYSAEYGQALSSVLALKTNAMPVEDQLNISLLTVGAELAGTKTWEQASVTSSLSYYNLGPYMQMVPQYTKWENEPQSLASDLIFRMNTGKSGIMKLYATINQSSLTSIEENLDQPGSSVRYKLVNDNQYLNASWTGEPQKDLILSTAFSFTNNVDRVSLDSTRYNKSLQGTHSKISLKYRFSDKLRILAGTEWYARTFAMGFPQAEILQQNSYTTHTLAAFLEAEIYASNSFVTRVGSRYEYSGYLRRASFAPRISAAYKMGSRSQLSLSYGWFFQDPDDEFLLFSNALRFERANHYTLNYLYKGEGRTLHSELYYKQYLDLVKYGVETGDAYAYINNEGDGSAYGLDLFWRDRKSIKNVEYWISYSYIESVRDYLDYPYEAVHNYTSRHNLSLVYKHWFNRLRSQLGVNYSISSPRSYNNPNSDVFNGERTKTYRSLNANWSFLLKQQVIIYATVSNILGTEQQFGYRYASIPDAEGFYRSTPIRPGAKRWILVGCFITLSKDKTMNQLDKIN